MSQVGTGLFIHPAHKNIIRAIHNCVTEGNVPDIVAVYDRLKVDKHLEDGYGVSYMIELMEMVPGPTNINYYIDRLVALSTEYRIQTLGAKLMSDVDNGIDDTSDYLMKLAADLIELTEIKQKIEIHDTEQIYTEINEQAATDFSGYSTGWSEVDNIIIGLWPGDLNLVAARPSVGKSSFLSNIAEYLGVEKEIPVLFVSLEQGRHAILRRIGCGNSENVNTRDLRIGRSKMSDLKWDEWVKYGGRAAVGKIKIVERPGITAMELRSVISRAVAMFQVKVVFVDYLQLMGAPEASMSEYQSVTYNSGQLKQIAREFNVPIVAAVQLRRSPDNKPPTESELKGSGALEQDADIIFLLYREREKDKEGYKPETACIISKQREGPTGIVDMMFHKKKTRFTLISRR